MTATNGTARPRAISVSATEARLRLRTYDDGEPRAAVDDQPVRDPRAGEAARHLARLPERHDLARRVGEQERRVAGADERDRRERPQPARTREAGVLPDHPARREGGEVH